MKKLRIMIVDESPFFRRWFRELIKITPVPKVILLTSEAYCRYQRKVSEKADFLLDKFTEYNKIPEILKSFASGSARGFNSPDPRCV